MSASGVPQVETRSRFSRGTTITIVVIVVLSVLTVYFYAQSTDYRGAKYRSQLQIATDMANTLGDSYLRISWLIDNTSSEGLRTYEAIVSTADADRLDHSCMEIAAMYPSYDIKHKGFEELGTAFNQLSVVLTMAYTDIIGQHHELTSDHRQTLETVLPVIGDLYSDFNSAVGKTMTFSDYPSSTVGHLDMDTLRVDAAAILSAL